MAVLTIRNLPDEVRDRLRVRAARAGTSMEAEVRAILIRASVELPESESGASLQDWVDALYAGNRPGDATGDLIRNRRDAAARERESKS
ncbi:MAG: FitA-like ribbon-helix-helix domain-containing protein [Wenzhouxiangella sp.]